MHINPISKYPFIETSNMLLSDGLRLGAGVISSAYLCLRCGKINYAQITFIGAVGDDGNQGKITVCDDNLNHLCNILFSNLNTDQKYLKGVAYDRSDNECGILIASADLKPILHSQYYPAPGEFIFTPSATSFMPLDNYTSGRLLNVNSEVINEIEYSDSFILDENSTATIKKVNDDPTNERRNPVKRVYINGVGVSDGEARDGIQLVPYPGSGILVSSSDNSILLGGYRDL